MAQMAVGYWAGARLAVPVAQIVCVLPFTRTCAFSPAAGMLIVAAKLSSPFPLQPSLGRAVGRVSAASLEEHDSVVAEDTGTGIIDGAKLAHVIGFLQGRIDGWRGEPRQGLTGPAHTDQ